MSKELLQHKRKHERYPLFAVAKVQIMDSNKPPMSCLLQCISKSGVGIYAYSVLESDTPVSIDIQFTNFEGNRVLDTVVGRVVSLADRDDVFCIGIEFNEELSPDKQLNLYEHLNEFARQK